MAEQPTVPANSTPNVDAKHAWQECPACGGVFGIFKDVKEATPRPGGYCPVWLLEDRKGTQLDALTGVQCPECGAWGVTALTFEQRRWGDKIPAAKKQTAADG